MGVKRFFSCGRAPLFRIHGSHENYFITLIFHDLPG
jgi:hypothetical protein